MSERASVRLTVGALICVEFGGLLAVELAACCTLQALIGIKEFQVLLTVVAFIVALGVLIAVHEWGHYRVAVACGVKVLRYSVGFGKPLLRWVGKKSGTEYVIAALPLGGYVRMLDEREGEVSPRKNIWPSTISPCAHVQPLLRRDLRPIWCWPWRCWRWSTGWAPTSLQPGLRLLRKARCCIRPVFKAATGCSVPLWVARNGSLCVPWVICAGW
jgi:hypothetical protein